MIDASITVVSDPGELAARAVERFIAVARESVARQGRFSAALSGGETPREMHRRLAAPPTVSAVPWSSTHFFWVDERCVPRESPHSNFGAAWGDFLSLVPIPADHLHPVNGELLPEDGAAHYELELVRSFHLKKNELPVFDLVILGMGSDGHTASLFPESTALSEKKRRVLSVHGGIPALDRITLTVPVLNRARHVVFLVSGAGKAERVKAVLSGSGASLPAGRIRPVKGELLWLLDREAARLLEVG